MANLDRGECYDVKPQIEDTQSTQKIQIPFFSQRKMQPAHHVHFRNPEGERIAHYADNFVNRVFKGVRITLFGCESTELAGQDADVGIIDVTIVNVCCVVAVRSLAHNVGNHSKSVKVIRTIEIERVRL